MANKSTKAKARAVKKKRPAISAEDQIRRARKIIEEEKRGLAQERTRYDGIISERRERIKELESEISRLSKIEDTLSARVCSQQRLTGNAYALLARELAPIKGGGRLDPRSDTIAAYDFTPNDKEPVMYLDWLKIGIKACAKEKILAIVMSRETSKLCFGCDGVNTWGTTPIVSSSFMGNGLVILVEKYKRP